MSAKKNPNKDKFGFDKAFPEPVPNYDDVEF